MMKKTYSIVLVAGLAMVVLFGCARFSKAVDPAVVQAQMIATKAEFRDKIAGEIADPVRANTFATLADERDELISQYAKSVQRYAETMKALNADYSATREDFEQVITGYNNDRRIGQENFLNLIGRMKGTTTESEWRKLSKFELKNMNPHAMVYSPEGA